MIDYDHEQAVLYDSSAVNVKKISFSNLVPWNVLKTYGIGKASILFHQNQMCLTFWDNSYDSKPEGQIVYEIRNNGSPIDLSCPRNYTSSDLPIWWIDGSCCFSKYSHAWFSFYVFQFFFMHPAKKACKQQFVLNKNLLLYCASGFFLCFIMIYGVLGTVFFIVSLKSFLLEKCEHQIFKFFGFIDE